MGITKTQLYPAEINELSASIKAISHPARLAILKHLAQTQTCVCGDLAEEIGLAQPTVSQHLKELKNAGLIQGTVDGTKVCYCIDSENWNQLRARLVDFFGQINQKSDCC
jgi:DNA-binding transcriptional ArsR family regulator